MASERVTLNGRYRLIGRIGAGGMSVVYKAQDVALGRLVAIKILHESLTGDPKFVENFRREAQAAASLSHPNVVTVHDVGQDGSRHYIVMELVEGEDLKTTVRNWAPLPLANALDLAIQICKGVGYAHRAGFVHCDVKPQNVLVTKDGRAMVADFGIARVISEATITRGDSSWGTPHYFSPEQAAGQSATPASDVYAIGIVLYEMLTGRLPFQADSPAALALKHLTEEPPPITDLNPNVPLPVARIIHKVLSKEPSARYRTADQLGSILQNIRVESEQGTSVELVSSDVPALVSENPADRPDPMSHGEASSFVSPVLKDADPDWAAVFLGAVALLAILGLIPLWILVYRAYLRPALPPLTLPVILLAIRSYFGIIL
jgi:serine/threonine-protein kinase